jgi:hypothetical protein
MGRFSLVDVRSSGRVGDRGEPQSVQEAKRAAMEAMSLIM